MVNITKQCRMKTVYSCVCSTTAVSRFSVYGNRILQNVEQYILLQGCMNITYSSGIYMEYILVQSTMYNAYSSVVE